MLVAEGHRDLSERSIRIGVGARVLCPGAPWRAPIGPRRVGLAVERVEHVQSERGGREAVDVHQDHHRHAVLRNESEPRLPAVRATVVRVHLARAPVEVEESVADGLVVRDSRRCVVAEHVREHRFGDQRRIAREELLGEVRVVLRRRHHAHECAHHRAVEGAELGDLTRVRSDPLVTRGAIGARLVRIERGGEHPRGREYVLLQVGVERLTARLL